MKCLKKPLTPFVTPFVTPFMLAGVVRTNEVLARLSKAKSTTHNFAQAIMKKLLKQKTYYPIS